MTILGHSRRKFLRRAGALTGALPFLGGVLPARAATQPRRLVLLMESNGTMVQHWRPAGTETNFTLRPESMLGPLEKHKANLVLVEPLKIYFGFGDQHFRGYTSLWTGVSAVGTSRERPYPGGKSVDQHVAAKVSAGKRYPTLNLGVVGQGTGARNCFATGSMQSIGPENDPYAVYKRLFEGLIVMSNPADGDKLIASRRSALDVIKQDLHALEARLTGAEKQKLGIHVQAIRTLENSLSLGASATCAKPKLPAPLNVRDSANFHTIEKIQQDVMVAAFACGLTSVSTLEWGASNNGQVYHWIGHTKDHHGLSHAAAAKELTEINQWLASRVGALMDSLQAIPEGAGTMLDNTLIVWGNELGIGGPHKETDFPALLAGGKNLGVRVGRYLKLPEQMSTNRLLVTICRAMGLDDQTYGDPAGGQGPIPGVLA